MRLAGSEEKHTAKVLYIQASALIASIDITYKGITAINIALINIALINKALINKAALNITPLKIAAEAPVYGRAAFSKACG